MHIWFMSTKYVHQILAMMFVSVITNQILIKMIDPEFRHRKKIRHNKILYKFGCCSIAYDNITYQILSACL